MRLLSILFGALVFSGGIVRAGAPATQPTTQPVLPVHDVYLLPFTSVSGDNHLDWAGKAVQQNLLTDLARARLHPVAADKSAGSITDAQAAARATDAKYLITGTYQMTDQLLRFNGQIIEVATGNVVGGLTVTGAERDLFSMEDSLSVQATQQLARLPGITINGPRPLGPVPAALQPDAVAQVIQPPAVGVGSNSYNGSALQQYVNSNRTPSNDFSQQLEDASNNYTYSSAPSAVYGTYYNYPYYGGYYGGYGGLYYSSGFGNRYGGYRGGFNAFGASGSFHGGGHGGRR